MFKKPENEIRRVKLDPAACESLKGQTDEYNNCLLNATENPDNPDEVILRKMKYKGLPSGNRREPQE